MKLLLESWNRYLNEGSSRWEEDLAELPPKYYHTPVEEAVETIANYVVLDEQPARDELRDLVELIDSEKYSDFLHWYAGKTYRGMVVTDQWLNDWLGAELGRTLISRMTKKHVFNIFKRLTGVITTKVSTRYDPNKLVGDEGWERLYGGEEKKLIESWSKNYNVAINYTTPGSLGPQNDFEDIITRKRILPIILEAKSSRGFLDLEPFYKTLPSMAGEKYLEEVPRLTGSVRIQKVHIPYLEFKKQFDRFAQRWTPQQRAEFTPHIREAAEKAGIVLF